MRWLFLILLLINGVYFGWQLRQSDEPVEGVRQAQVASLKLLSEVDRSTLLPRQVVKAESSAGVSIPDETMCYVVTGIESEVEALDLQERIERLGLNALLLQTDVERVEMFELILNRPADYSQQQALEARLVEQGFNVETEKLGPRDVYVIGRFKTRAALNQARDSVSQQFVVDEYEVMQSLPQYEVWIEANNSLETDNKINEVDGFLDSAIKIEKKLCKRVASTGARD
ncbi:hypothetical protein EH243_14105 [Amphritea opalescens]|uniref:SPOR domain-containing protein n=1 Tax=Amphritea opalescens TaxID=2490544 RepID=A0A430KNC6_9GAMM|nr:hypothetical protein [Amphritea opalescens]RTE64997.1 hypothetical protein EH243_14105 [Amphritea opalescens]